MNKRPVALVILDGWGLAEPTAANAIAAAQTPVIDRLTATCPHTQLQASSLAVGVREGQIGNSEVGHLNLGAGRVVEQSIVRIDAAIASGAFYQNRVLVDAVDRAIQKKTSVHLIGLVSDAGVHSAQSHIFALIELARRQGIPKDRLLIHAITDGRDSLPTSGGEQVRALEAELARQKIGWIATVVGRYWAMDRDNNWDRIAKAVAAYQQGNGHPVATAEDAVLATYAQGNTDEFVEPSRIGTGAETSLRDQDELIVWNFRADRMRQLVRVLGTGECPGQPTPAPPNIGITTLTQYDARFTHPVAFDPQPVSDTLGSVIANAGLRQLRIAETEKYAHVTYFFNGGEDPPLKGEERILVPSPKVATYDLQPQMSLPEVARKACEAIRSHRFDLIVLNFANPDMVGHTGSFEGVVRAVEAVDTGVGELLAAQRDVGGTTVITADHGNAERMIDAASGGPDTAHTTNPVPVILVGDHLASARLSNGGRLCDVAPTILQLLDTKGPAAMTGRSLLR